MEKLYRKGVGAFIINNENQIFMAERLDVKNQWQMPQGGVEENENLDVAIFRELQEEIGTDKFNIISKTNWLKYDLPTDAQKNLSNGKYIGQQQIWYFLEFLGDNDDINLNFDKHPEFSQWEWVQKETLLDRIINFKKNMYQEIINFAIVNKIIL